MKTLIIGTAGHIDHGKTALIKALTSIDCDTHKEEKRRGITINLGFSHLDFEDGNSYGIIDVPGHKDFINTMISGASGMDMVLLIIAADSGIMPQTIEHLNIISTLGISNLIVVLTKTDLVDEDLIELASMEILELLENYNFEDSDIVPVSALNGQGIDKLKDLIKHKSNSVPEKSSVGGFRMYIDRIFSVVGKGTVVTGSVLSGKIGIGEELFLYPGEIKSKVKGIQKHGKDVDFAIAGSRTALNITNIKTDDFEKGMILCSKQFDESSLIDAELLLFPAVSEIKLWSTVVFQSGTYECPAKIHLLNRDKLSEKEKAIVQIHLSKAACLMAGDKFIIRNSSADRTLGGGTVIDASPLHHRKRTEKLLQQLDILRDSLTNKTNRPKLVAITLEKEGLPMTAEQISNNTGIAIADLPPAQKGLFDIIKISDYQAFIGSKVLEELKSIIVNSLQQFHNLNTMFQTGLSVAELAGKDKRFSGKNGIHLLNAVLLLMANEKIVELLQQTWKLCSHSANLTKKQQEEIDWLEMEIQNYNLQKPVMSEIEESAKLKNINKESLKTYLKYLQITGKIYRYENEFVHNKILDQCRIKIVNHLKTKEMIDIREFREILDATKKICPIIMTMMEKQGYLTVKPVEFNYEIRLKLK